MLHNYIISTLSTIYYPLSTRPAGGVDVVIPVEGEAVLADLVHEQVGLQVQRAPARAVTARSVQTEVTMVSYRGGRTPAPGPGWRGWRPDRRSPDR